MEPELIFKAMADRTRQRTMAVLCRHELSVSELVAVLRQPQSTISRHLKTLRDAGLIRDRRDGSTVLYAAARNIDATNGAALPARILDWATEQTLDPQLQTRMETALRRRREMSDRFFGDVGVKWDKLRIDSFGSQFHLEAFWSLLPGEWTVADIGTGSGYLLPALAAYFEKVIAVDPVDAMLASATQRIEMDQLDNISLRRGDLSLLPIMRGEVDLAIASLVLHHTAVPLDAIRELHRILKPGGRVLVIEQLTHENQRFRERMQDRWSGFDPGELRGQFEQAGFGDVQARQLLTAQQAEDAPELFAITGRKPSNGSTAT